MSYEDIVFLLNISGCISPLLAMVEINALYCIDKIFASVLNILFSFNINLIHWNSQKYLFS